VCSHCPRPCAKGFVCASSGGGMVCMPRAKQGERCDFTDLDMCEDGLFCSLVVSVAYPNTHRICRPQIAASAPCSDPAYDACAPPNVCYAAPGSDAGAQCVPVPLLQPGQLCPSSSPAQCVCPSACLNGTCTPVLDVGTSPCLMFGTDVLSCRHGTCDGRDGDGGTCVANVAPGQACDPSVAGCGSETCDPASRRCTPYCY
jgi:hypothetical protein